MSCVNAKIGLLRWLLTDRPAIFTENYGELLIAGAVQVDGLTILPPDRSVIEISDENHCMDIMLEEIIQVYFKIKGFYSFIKNYVKFLNIVLV